MSNQIAEARVTETATIPRKFVALSRYLTFLPEISRPQSFRQRIADGLFAFFVLLARFGFVIGGVIGCFVDTQNSFLPGLLAGAVAGFLIRRSLGLRGRNLTHGFFVRMLERGNGNSSKLLESLIERVRGDDFTPRQCRVATSAYAEAQRELQSCPSDDERRTILEELDRKVTAALYGGMVSSPVSDSGCQGSDMMEPRRSGGFHR
jgi:hypothetical protein